MSSLPAPPLNGDGHTWHHADGLLYRIVSQGGQLWEDPSLPQFKSGMPAFEEQLSHEEIIAVIEYVKSLWADKEIRGVSILEHQTLMSETDPFPSVRQLDMQRFISASSLERSRVAAIDRPQMLTINSTFPIAPTLRVNGINCSYGRPFMA